MVIIVGSSTGDENKKIITIPKGSFRLSIFTTTGIVEHEQNGVIKANNTAPNAAIILFFPANFFSNFSKGIKLLQKTD